MNLFETLFFLTSMKQGIPDSYLLYELLIFSCLTLNKTWYWFVVFMVWRLAIYYMFKMTKSLKKVCMAHCKSCCINYLLCILLMSCCCKAYFIIDTHCYLCWKVLLVCAVWGWGFCGSIDTDSSLLGYDTKLLCNKVDCLPVGTTTSSSFVVSISYLFSH